MSSPNTGSDPARFHFVMIKPTHYDDDGYPIQWLRSAIPSNTLACLNALAEDARRREVLGAGVVLWAMSAAAPEPRRVWPFYVVFGVCGLARSFLQTSRSALVAEIVPRALFANAATWRSSTWQAGQVVGPALGGVLFAAFGARVALGLNVLIGVVALMTMLRVRHAPTKVVAAGVSVVRALVEGLRYVGRERVILGALTLDLAVFFGGAVAMLPIFDPCTLGRAGSGSSPRPGAAWELHRAPASVAPGGAGSGHRDRVWSA